MLRNYCKGMTYAQTGCRTRTVNPLFPVKLANYEVTRPKLGDCKLNFIKLLSLVFRSKYCGNVRSLTKWNLDKDELITQKSTRKRCEVCSELSIKTLERRHWYIFLFQVKQETVIEKDSAASAPVTAPKPPSKFDTLKFNSCFGKSRTY